ncbi:hypothetical protein AK830_g2444 [Neonectria ditissima]|uniref:ABM domain-containing protein n=1 Tax=Neonectria ditissima TaxID=78410 RepID=A0A0P7BEY4_9HYPO|nr:hypothetical protein AK830_g2444 [Neonectria ditissima]
MGVKPDLNVMDQATLEGDILTTAWKTVLTKPGGPHRVFWGLETDDPSRLWAFFDWDSIEQHEQFAKTHGADAVKDIPKICTHGELTKHIAMAPSSDVLQSPSTEVLLVYFPAEISSMYRDETSSSLQDIFTMSLRNCPDVKEVAYGWGMENDFPVRGKSGQLASVLIGFIGLSDVKTQAKFHNADAYKEVEAKIKSLEGVVNFYGFSIECQKLERDN